MQKSGSKRVRYIVFYTCSLNVGFMEICKNVIGEEWKIWKDNLISKSLVLYIKSGYFLDHKSKLEN